MAPRSSATTRLAGEDLGHIVGGDLLRQAFDDGGLADAGLADQHRVVLGAAGEDLDQAQDLVIAPDDRVELAFAGQLGQVARIFLQRAVARFGLRVGDPLSAAQVLDGIVDAVTGQPGAIPECGPRGCCARSGWPGRYARWRCIRPSAGWLPRWPGR